MVIGVGLRMGILDFGGDRRRGRAILGVNLGRPIVTNGAFATRSSQITLRTCYYAAAWSIVKNVSIRLSFRMHVSGITDPNHRIIRCLWLSLGPPLRRHTLCTFVLWMTSCFYIAPCGDVTLLQPRRCSVVHAITPCCVVWYWWRTVLDDDQSYTVECCQQWTDDGQ